MNVCTTKNTWIGEEYSPQLIETVNVMRRREESSFNCHDYLNASLSSLGLGTIDELWRQNTAEWMFKVIDFYVREECAFVCKYITYVLQTV